MTQQYKSFSFNGIVWSDLLNVTLSNDFYAACLRGSRNIIEEKIPGRDLPYFYEVDDEPLEFEVNFATEEPLTRGQIKALARALISHSGYKPLHFGDIANNVYTRKTPFFNVVFIGEADFNFIGAGLNNSGFEIYNGYFTLTARVDRPYGYLPVKIVNQPTAIIGTVSESFVSTITELTTDHGFVINDIISATAGTGTLGTGVVTVTAVATNQITVSSTLNMTAGTITNLGIAGLPTTAGGIQFTNSADIEISPGIIFTNAANTTNKIRLYNETNDTSVTFTSLDNGERITISAALKTINSTVSGIYSRWERDELILEPGVNNLRFENYTTIWNNYNVSNFVITYEAPSYMLGD